MVIPVAMDDKDVFRTRLEVERFNKALEKGARKSAGSLGKDDFLKLLIAQLQNQDPTRPLEDKEFIAQMAQFSSLEQMVEMNKTLGTLIAENRTGLTTSLLGKRVDVFDDRTGRTVGGIVDEVRFQGGMGGEAAISFNGMSYMVERIVRVRENGRE